MEVSGILHNLAAFLPGKKPVHVDYEVGSPESWSECFDKEKNLSPTRIQTSVHPVHSLLYHISTQLQFKLCQQTTQWRDIMYKST